MAGSKQVIPPDTPGNGGPRPTPGHPPGEAAPATASAESPRTQHIANHENSRLPAGNSSASPAMFPPASREPASTPYTASRGVKLARRALLGGAAAFGGALAWNWNRIPFGFVQQYWREMDRAIGTPRRIPDPKTWPDRGVHAAWLGHSTVLLKIDGVTVLTDPVFSTRAGIDLFLFTIGVKRLINPALDLKKLPPIDLILVSHAHMDHLDIPSLRALENKGTRVITARETSDLFRPSRYRSFQELGWNESAQAGEARVTGLEVNHWGARMRTDTHRGYNGYLIQAGSRQVLFAGDTADTDTFRRLPGNAKPDLAVFPIGAYNPWIRYHCNPEQAWRMVNEARAEVVLPVHHQTFSLSREPVMEPLERFYAAAGAADSRIGWQEIGATFHWS